MTAPATLSREGKTNLIQNNIRTNFAATTFIDHSPFTENEILRNFAATTLHYGVQECVAVRFGTDDASFEIPLTLTNGKVTMTTVYPHAAPICSAPVFVEVVPNPSLPQCAASGVIETPLDKVNIRPELSGTELIPTHDRESIVIVDEDGKQDYRRL